jgi:hypothetical protein
MWKVVITTSGGFAGRGLGSVDLAGPATALARTAEEERIARAIDDVRPEEWQAAYGSNQPDDVRYRLLLIRDGRQWDVEWTESAFGQLPPDLAELFEAAWS